MAGGWTQISEVVLVEGSPSDAAVQHAGAVRMLLAAVAPEVVLRVVHWRRTVGVQGS